MRSYIVLLLSASLYAETIGGSATITTLKGTGSIETAPASVGSQAKSGQTVKVEKDSSAIFWLSNGSRLVLNPNSVVLFKTLKQEDSSVQTPNPEDKSQKETGASITEIEVISGKVIGDVKKLAKDSVYTLRTPVGVVTIKGTVFSVEYKKNDDGTVAFNIGCLVGRVSVQMADPNVPPISVPAGKQLTISAPMPPPTAGKDDAVKPPEKKEGDKKKEGEGDKPKPAEGDKPAKEGEQPAPPPPPPPMKIQLEAMPPKEMAAIRIADVAPPPPPSPPPKPPAASAVDNVIDKLEKLEMSEQVTNPSPTGG
jgi:hypothetical protein